MVVVVVVPGKSAKMPLPMPAALAAMV